MSAGWAELETHVVNRAFLLRRCVGSSDHSGVFLTQSANHAPSTVALKLIPFDPDSADAQLSRWRATVDLSHPHLIRIFDAGECELGGQRYLYALMEYAEENLAQLLEQRALSEHEAREMLEPTLGALAYLHGNKLVQGRLKPSNILVVGDQLKLASDTVRAAGKPAEDVWALGVTLCEAFARRRPSGLDGVGEVESPSEVPASFRETVARCLSRNPQDRPQVSELQSWLRGESQVGAAGASLQPPALPESAGLPPPRARPAQASTMRLVIRVEIPPEEEPRTAIPERSSRRALALVVGAVAVLALGWVGYRVFRADAGSAPTAQEAVRDVRPPSPGAISAPPTPAPGVAASVSAEPPLPQSATSTAVTGSARAASVEAESQAAPDAMTSPLNEVIPDVPRSALQTIRGTVRVSVRVIVDKDGTVLAATPDDPGPSRYFERLALESSKKWTFAPADSEEQRLMLVRFNFTRAGTTASAKPLR
jgi:TonB family protein